MEKWALIQEGTVLEIIEIGPDEPSLDQRYHSDLIARMVPVGPEVRAGWVVAGEGGFAPPPSGPRVAEIRARRDALLAASDRTQLLDTQLSPEQRQAWATYRQALRDLPAQPGFPSSVTWPVAPAG